MITLSACMLSLCLAANALTPCDLPATEAAAASSAIVWENGITADTVATEQPLSETAKEATAANETTVASVNDYAHQVAQLVNAERTTAGLPALTLDADLCHAAQVRAKEIQTLFSHDRPDGSSCFTVLKELGISYVACGENIAKGSQTPEAVMDGWMHSAGHKANILNTHFTKIGVAAVQSSSGVWHWVQIFAA